MNLILIPLGIALLSLGFVGWLVRHVRHYPDGTEPMQRIANAIREGAYAFLSRQYRTIALIGLALAVLIFGVYALTGETIFGLETAVAFVLGAVCSGLAGYAGMAISVRANLKTAAAADRKSLNDAIRIALRAGATEGILVVALSLLGIAVLYLVYQQIFGVDPRDIPSLIIGFGFGASIVALFAQLGGGIYTKAADVGADLVGKVEAGIPEDDPRNPAVIADLVGDNVGDCAGRGADLFESIAAENIGAMILGVALYRAFGVEGILYPLVVLAVGLVASAIGLLTVSVSSNDADPLAALNRGFYVTSALVAVGLVSVTYWLLGEHALWFSLAGLIGIVLSIIFLQLTRYYTDHRFRPVKSIALASETGPATNIISGLAVGLENVGLPVIAIAAALMGSYALGEASGIHQGGIYGTAVATIGMLASAAYVLAMDTFGPITDNAGGIVEMSQSSEETRAITDRLDAAGNTTKALTKGYAVGSAALAAFLLFSAYLEEANLTSVDLSKVPVFIGGMLGAALVFVFSAYAIRAVGKAAGAIIEEVRRQFREHPGIMQGTEQPSYRQAVDIATRSALREMVLPGLLAVVVPVAVGLIFRAEAVAATLMVGTIVGVIMALFMNNTGGAWDNAKKFIEAGGYTDTNGQVQGKKTPVHAAAVVGDTVGDPLKDTAGPSLHVLIKLLSTLTLVLAALFV